MDRQKTIPLPVSRMAFSVRDLLHDKSVQVGDFMTDIPVMTPQIAFDAIHNEAFRLVLKESIEAPDFIDEFCRVFGCEKPERRASALEEMIDQATGYRQHQWNEFFKQFIPFVHRVVYMPLLCQLDNQG